MISGKGRTFDLNLSCRCREELPSARLVRRLASYLRVEVLISEHAHAYRSGPSGKHLGKACWAQNVTDVDQLVLH